MVPFGLRLLRTIDARLDFALIEPIEGLASQSPLQCFGEFLGRGKTMPGSLGHCLVNDPADRLADQWIQIADGGSDMAANGLGGVHFGLASEWLASGQGFVADYRQREDVGKRGAE